MELLLVSTLIIFCLGYVQPKKERPDVDCYRKDYPLYYRGHIDKTIGNKTCTNWEIIGYNDVRFSGNYCRATPGWKPWCYKEGSKTDWGYCDVPMCKETTTVPVPDIDCYTGEDGLNYRGHLYITKGGNTCNYWNTTTYTGIKWAKKMKENYCRATDDYGPWCYIGPRVGPYEKCEVPKCKDACRDKDKRCAAAYCQRGNAYYGWSRVNCLKTCNWCDPCKNPDKCQNGGTCTGARGQTQYTCNCPENFFGVNCGCDAMECNRKRANTGCTKPTWVGTSWYKASRCDCKPGYLLNTKTDTCDTCGPKEAMEWCELSCENTMCKYRGPRKDAGCQIVEYGGKINVNEEDKQAVLDTFNKLRQKVASGKEKGLPAANKTMPDLKWDDGLAELAQRWTTQCPMMEHDGHRHTPKFWKTSQTGFRGAYKYFSTWDKDYRPADGMTWGIPGWYNEYKGFIRNGCTVDKNPGNQCALRGGHGATVGHWMVLIHQTTTHVGCGYAWFNTNSPRLSPTKTWLLVYCNYGGGPGYNPHSSPIYQ